MLREPGTHERLNARSDELRRGLQAVLDRRGMEALVIGDGSLWQILFTDKTPTNHAEYLRADLERTKALDQALLRNGVLVMPLIRRLVSTAHDDDDFEATFRALDAACRELG